MPGTTSSCWRALAACEKGDTFACYKLDGAGKTTLLKLIGGELAPESGSIVVPRAARIGHVAQEAGPG